MSANFPNWSPYIPDGFFQVIEGKLLKNDWVWNKRTGHFEKVKIDGTVSVEQCHFVVRKNEDIQLTTLEEWAAENRKDLEVLNA